MKEMVLMPSGPGAAVKVLKPEMVHWKVELSEQVWRLMGWGAARAREAKERMVRACIFGDCGCFVS